VTVPRRPPRPIHTAESFYAQHPIRAAVPARALRLAARADEPRPAELCWRLFGPAVEPPADDDIEGEIVAYVNEARWVADCPDKRCNAAQVVSPADPRFLCAVCGNLANRRRWYRIAFPSANARRQIEGLIGQRPRLETVNWVPGESVADLKRQNREHGVPDEVV
jgi:hypothetical protein